MSGPEERAVANLVSEHIAKLEKDKAELLDALEDIIDTGFCGGPQGKRARTAIANAKERN